MVKRYKDAYASASITIKTDGTAILKVRTINGAVIHNKPHKNEKAAYSAWRRMCN